jgi:hypothetical protein
VCNRSEKGLHVHDQDALRREQEGAAEMEKRPTIQVKATYYASK